jgi:hypothetical protein
LGGSRQIVFYSGHFSHLFPCHPCLPFLLHAIDTVILSWLYVTLLPGAARLLVISTMPRCPKYQPQNHRVGKGRGYITCLAHQPVSSQNIVSMTHTAEPLASFCCTPDHQQPQGLALLEWEEGGCTNNKTLGPDQASPHPTPPALAGRRRSYCKTLHLLMPD